MSQPQVCYTEDFYRHQCATCGVEFDACLNHPPVKCPSGHDQNASTKL